MRKILTLILSFSVIQSLAQTPNGGTSAEVPSTIVALSKIGAPSARDLAQDEVFRKNSIKINLSSLVFNNYSLSYERALNRKFTVVAGYSFLPETNVGSMSLVNKAIDRLAEAEDGEEDDVVEQLKSATVASKAYTGELRYYPGKKPGARGFYLSLYGRYLNMDANYVHEYETDNFTYNIPIDGNVKGLGGGLMIGSQWLIAKRVAFDWYILGAHYGKMDVDLAGMSNLSTMTAQERRDLEEDIESINDSLPGNSEVDATVTDQGVTVKGKTPFLGIRGLGFSLGIAF